MRSECDFLFSQFFRNEGFVRLQPPIITSSDCEGAGEVFSITTKAAASKTNCDGEPTAETQHFFREPKFLTVSSQLHLEAFVHEHQKVWTLSPTFRAERSDTPRHVSEFWMLEAELRTSSLQEIMDNVESMIKFVVRGLQGGKFIDELAAAKRLLEPSQTAESTKEIASISTRWETLIKASWPRIDYTSAIKLLKDAYRSKQTTFVYEPTWNTGLQLEHEKFIAETVGQGGPVFVTDYPQFIKPFYMLPSDTRDRKGADALSTVACFDLLLPELCEVVGGSLREHRLANLEENMQNNGLRSSSERGQGPGDRNGHPMSLSRNGNLDWYVDLRRYGSIPHGGFGLGLDRLLCYLGGLHNIKDVVPWPRYYGRCDC